ncbi:energy-coupling factor ABC transporter ATP-binding protein [Loktanella sp. S4079]|uniref:energy-coupling factor ABC transporter ATP-binding protein n=1 Tax=Loktanella sp. S4079 TaxID=579483 RepID=UPI0005F9DD2C|nr:ABC transporter ATP-binding protein [Loktanella sp. S4079]KJZ19173.1 cobalt ABC transporter [Loktanella sp. S4079]
MDGLHTETQHPTVGSTIALTGLSFSVTNKVILSDVSVETNAARIGIVGRNGSGKSTLARILAGLIAPTSGTACVNGHNLSKDRKAALTEVGILFQNPDHQIIFPTVNEEISFGLRQLGLSKDIAAQKTNEILTRFGKSHWAEAYINTLSQGQKHLVCLMAVTAMGPKAIILDEPFTGLDIPTKAQLNRYLNHYHGSLIHITHAPEDLKGYDHIIWLEQGKVEKSGPADAILPEYIQRMQTLGGLDDISDLSG